MKLTIDEFAKRLSHELHAGQYRNDGVTPYTVHTDAVGDNVHKFLNQDSFLLEKNLRISMAIGYCHDIAEDVIGNDREQLMSFGADYPEWKIVIDGVLTLSRFSKDEPIIEYLRKIKHSIYARAVKLADLEHNLSDLSAGNLRDKYHLCKNFLEN